MRDVKEVSIRNSIFKCFNDEFEDKRSNAENCRVARALLLSGWERVGKFTTRDRRNQVKFENRADCMSGSIV